MNNMKYFTVALVSLLFVLSFTPRQVSSLPGKHSGRKLYQTPADDDDAYNEPSESQEPSYEDDSYDVDHEPKSIEKYTTHKYTVKYHYTTTKKPKYTKSTTHKPKHYTTKHNKKSKIPASKETDDKQATLKEIKDHDNKEKPTDSKLADDGKTEHTTDSNKSEAKTGPSPNPDPRDLVVQTKPVKTKKSGALAPAKEVEHKGDSEKSDVNGTNGGKTGSENPPESKVTDTSEKGDTKSDNSNDAVKSESKPESIDTEEKGKTESDTSSSSDAHKSDTAPEGTEGQKEGTETDTSKSDISSDAPKSDSVPVPAAPTGDKEIDHTADTNKSDNPKDTSGSEATLQSTADTAEKEQSTDANTKSESDTKIPIQTHTPDATHGAGTDAKLVEPVAPVKTETNGEPLKSKADTGTGTDEHKVEGKPESNGDQTSQSGSSGTNSNNPIKTIQPTNQIGTPVAVAAAPAPAPATAPSSGSGFPPTGTGDTNVSPSSTGQGELGLLQMVAEAAQQTNNDQGTGTNPGATNVKKPRPLALDRLFGR